MKSALKPLTCLNSFLLAGLLATAGASAMAQAAPAAPMAGLHDDRMGRHDPAKMQAWVAKHQADLKAKLKITPTQESAWLAFTASMQSPARVARLTPEQRAEFDKLSTPERIDKMRALRAQHLTEMTAAMDQHGEAIKTFYAALNPDQQKIFDAEHRQFGQRNGHDQHRWGMHS